MHLIELIASLEAAKVARGNIRLVDVSIVSAGDAQPLVDYTDRPTRPAAPVKVIDVTGMHEEQIDELRAEYPTATFLHKIVPISTAPGEPCNVVNETRGACTLKIGHEGEHVWANPENAPGEAAKKLEAEIEAAKNMTDAERNAAAEKQLGETMAQAAAKLPPEPETTTLGPVNVAGSASTDGGEPVTIPIPNTPQE